MHKFKVSENSKLKKKKIQNLKNDEEDFQFENQSESENLCQSDFT